MDQTIVGTILPRVAADLGDPSHLYAWVFTAYLLTVTASAPLAGKLGDLRGHRHVLLGGIAALSAASAAAALAWSMPLLVLCRALQGVGGGLISASAFALLGDLYSLRDRGRMMGLFSGVYALASLIGPLLGGALADLWHWRAAFWLTVPLGLLAALTLLGTLPAGPPRGARGPLDLPGAALLVAAVLGILLACAKQAAGLALRPLLAVMGLGCAVAGGKARGLARLLAAGLAVPPGIVAVLDPADPLPPALAERCASLGGPWAVRSSADQEDGADLSFAGQFESVLGVRDQEGLRDALARCLAAATTAAVAVAYRAGAGVAARGGIALIVQRMVAARCAGVLFTVDPVTGAADRLVIEAVSGTGERLTAGLAHAERYVLSKEGAVLEAPAAQARLLGEGDLAAIWDGARRATAAFGGALDLEWALAQDGALLWLQARPVTAQGAGEMLESPPPDPSWVLTTYNIREVMPGAMRPWPGCGGQRRRRCGRRSRASFRTTGTEG